MVYLYICFLDSKLLEVWHGETVWHGEESMAWWTSTGGRMWPDSSRGPDSGGPDRAFDNFLNTFWEGKNNQLTNSITVTFKHPISFHYAEIATDSHIPDNDMCIRTDEGVTCPTDEGTTTPSTNPKTVKIQPLNPEWTVSVKLIFRQLESGLHRRAVLNDFKIGFYDSKLCYF